MKLIIEGKEVEIETLDDFMKRFVNVDGTCETRMAGMLLPQIISNIDTFAMLLAKAITPHNSLFDILKKIPINIAFHCFSSHHTVVFTLLNQCANPSSVLFSNFSELVLYYILNDHLRLASLEDEVFKKIMGVCESHSALTDRALHWNLVMNLQYTNFTYEHIPHVRERMLKFTALIERRTGKSILETIAPHITFNTLNELIITRYFEETWVCKLNELLECIVKYYEDHPDELNIRVKMDVLIFTMLERLNHTYPYLSNRLSSLLKIHCADELFHQLLSNHSISMLKLFEIDLHVKNTSKKILFYEILKAHPNLHTLNIDQLIEEKMLSLEDIQIELLSETRVIFYAINTEWLTKYHLSEKILAYYLKNPEKAKLVLNGSEYTAHLIAILGLTNHEIKFELISIAKKELSREKIISTIIYLGKKRPEDLAGFCLQLDVERDIQTESIIQLFGTTRDHAIINTALNMMDILEILPSELNLTLLASRKYILFNNTAIEFLTKISLLKSVLEYAERYPDYPLVYINQHPDLFDVTTHLLNQEVQQFFIQFFKMHCKNLLLSIICNVARHKPSMLMEVAEFLQVDCVVSKKGSLLTSLFLANPNSEHVIQYIYDKILAGADPNALGIFNNTLLQRVVRTQSVSETIAKSHLKLIHLLLKFGADPAEGGKGTTCPYTSLLNNPQYANQTDLIILFLTHAHPAALPKLLQERMNDCASIDYLCMTNPLIFKAYEHYESPASFHQRLKMATHEHQAKNEFLNLIHILANGHASILHQLPKVVFISLCRYLEIAQYKTLHEMLRLYETACSEKNNIRELAKSPGGVSVLQRANGFTFFKLTELVALDYEKLSRQTLRMKDPVKKEQSQRKLINFRLSHGVQTLFSECELLSTRYQKIRLLERMRHREIMQEPEMVTWIEQTIIALKK